MAGDLASIVFKEPPELIGRSHVAAMAGLIAHGLKQPNTLFSKSSEGGLSMVGLKTWLELPNVADQVNLAAYCASVVSCAL